MPKYGAQLRNFIYQVADSRRYDDEELFHDGTKTLVNKVIAERIQVHPSYLSRAIHDEHKDLKLSFFEGLMAWAKVDTLQELFQRMKSAPTAPPEAWKH